MQRGWGGRDNFFGGFGGTGRDPFDDPFFTQPFGRGLSMLGPSMFASQRSFFRDPSNTGFLEPQPPKGKGPVIQELFSDDDDDEEEDGGDDRLANDNLGKQSKEPYVVGPDDETKEEESNDTQSSTQARAYRFHSSTVTYGGVDGAYYTSSTMRRTGGNGVTVEESKEADTTTGRATHRVSRGIHDKGHSVTRKLNDGRVDTMQTLHNLNEDELAGFEEAWKGNARQHLPGWNQGVDILDNANKRNSTSFRRDEQAARGEQATRGWALPATQQSHGSGSSRTQSRPKSFRVTIE